MTFGTIPDQIIIVSSIEQPVYRRWEDASDDENDSLKTSEEMVIPAFVCEPNNSRTLGRAVEWAERARTYYDSAKKKNVIRSEPVVQELRDNSIMTDLKVVGTGTYNYTTTYKVVDSDKYYYDLPQDVMFDTMIECGIDPGGKLRGEYIWAKIGSTMKIVRVGSELHEKLIHFTGRAKLKKIGLRDLEPGGVYANAKGDLAVFIGRVNYVKYSYESIRSNYNYASGSYSNNYKYFKTKVTKAQAWVPLYKKDSSWSADEDYKERKSAGYYIRLLTSSSTYIEKIDQINDFDWKKEIAQISFDTLKKHSPSKIPNLTNSNVSVWEICNSSSQATMMPADETFELPQEYLTLDALALPCVGKK